MTFKLGSNISSLIAQRRLAEAGSNSEKSYEKLASGLRINKGADDAAGLSIADQLNANSRIFSQAVRNTNDGISFLAVAESAVNSLFNINSRLKELAQQAANGVYSSVQRAALDREAQALSDEYFRIAKTTEFNGLKIFDGSLSNGLSVQAGIGTAGIIQSTIAGKLGTGATDLSAFVDGESSRSFASTLGDINGDGILDLVTAGRDDANDGIATVQLGNGNGTFGVARSYTTESNASFAVSLTDINGDGNLDLITAGQTDANTGFITTRFGTGNGTFGTATSYQSETTASLSLAFSDVNKDGLLDLVSGGVGGGIGYSSVRLGTGSGAFGFATSYSSGSGGIRGVALGDINGDGIIDLVSSGYTSSNDGFASVRLGSANGTFGTATTYATESRISYAVTLRDLNKDGFLDIVTAGQTDGLDGAATVLQGNANGTFGTGVSYATESNRTWALALEDINGDGTLDLVTGGRSDGASNDSYSSIRLGSGNGQFASATSTFLLSGGGGAFISSVRSVALGDLNGDGVIDIVASGYQSTGGGSYDGESAILLGRSTAGISPLQRFDLLTAGTARQAAGGFSRNEGILSEIKSSIGAAQSRLSSALQSSASSRDLYAEARTRIIDADVAEELSKLIRSQVLEKAAAAILAQANLTPQIVMKLLQ